MRRPTAKRVGGCALAPHGWQLQAQSCAPLTHCRAPGPRTGDFASLGRAANDQACACEGPTRRGGSVQASDSLKDRKLLPGAAVAVRPAGAGSGRPGTMTTAHRTRSVCAARRRRLVLAGPGFPSRLAPALRRSRSRSRNATYIEGTESHATKDAFSLIFQSANPASVRSNTFGCDAPRSQLPLVGY